jgi:hypothetical protein
MAALLSLGGRHIADEMWKDRLFGCEIADRGPASADQALICVKPE